MNWTRWLDTDEVHRKKRTRTCTGRLSWRKGRASLMLFVEKRFILWHMRPEGLRSMVECYLADNRSKSTSIINSGRSFVNFSNIHENEDKEGSVDPSELDYHRESCWFRLYWMENEKLGGWYLRGWKVFMEDAGKPFHGNAYLRLVASDWSELSLLLASTTNIRSWVSRCVSFSSEWPLSFSLIRRPVVLWCPM